MQNQKKTLNEIVQITTDIQNSAMAIYASADNQSLLDMHSKNIASILEDYPFVTNQIKTDEATFWQKVAENRGIEKLSTQRNLKIIMSTNKALDQCRERELQYMNVFMKPENVKDMFS